ncbi:MAG: histidine kinase [Anaerolineae bacterium]
MTFLARSLRLKVSLGVCLALIGLFAPLNWLQYRLQRKAALADLQLLAASAGTIAEHSLEEAMLANNRSAIQGIVDSVAQAPGVRTVYLLNPRAIVAASPQRAFNNDQLDRSSPTCQVCHQFPAASRPRGVVVTGADGQRAFRTMTPIPNREACHRCHSPEDRLNGVFYMDFSMAGLDARLESGLRTAFLSSVAIIILSALVLYVLLSRLIITPMEQVAHALRRFSRGERVARVPVQAQDEVGLLADVFDEMADTIQTQESEASRLYTELKAKDAVRRQLLARLITAREEERRRLAREIHDELGQLLTGLSLTLKLGQEAVGDDPQTARDYLDKANALVRHTIEQSHRLITDLRPTVLDDYGLVPALQEELNQRLAPLGIDAHLHTEGDIERLPAEVATAAFRIAQEAITNVIRHAHAHQVHVRLQQTADGLTVTVDDDGTGLPKEILNNRDERQPLGILGMQERAGALGGRLEVIAREPHGTRVHLWLPVQKKAS